MARAVGDQVNILAIDPGPTESAYVFFDGEKVWSCGKYQNHTVLGIVKQSAEDAEGANRLVIEMIAHYGSGMPAGKSVFDTCVWIGRFTQVACERIAVEQVMRATVKAHLCRSAKAKDSNVRQALIDLFGGKENAIGTKKTPGPLYGISGDVWAALAVAVTWYDANMRTGAIATQERTWK
jgi:hypothetical protein